MSEQTMSVATSRRLVCGYLVLLMVPATLAGFGCAGPSYDATFTRAEASGEREVSAVNVVKNPAESRHIYTCNVRDGSMKCQKACGDGKIRCPVNRANVEGTTYNALGSRSTIPTNVSPEARQPSRASSEKSKQSSSADGSKDNQPDKPESESDESMKPEPSSSSPDDTEEQSGDSTADDSSADSGDDMENSDSNGQNDEGGTQ